MVKKIAGIDAVLQNNQRHLVSFLQPLKLDYKKRNATFHRY